MFLLCQKINCQMLTSQGYTKIKLGYFQHDDFYTVFWSNNMILYLDFFASNSSLKRPLSSFILPSKAIKLACIVFICDRVSSRVSNVLLPLRAMSSDKRVIAWVLAEITLSFSLKFSCRREIASELTIQNYLKIEVGNDIN